MNRARWLAIGGVALLALLAPLAWYLISPLFITRTVDEAFPAVVAAPAPTVAGATSGATSTPVAVLSATAAPAVVTTAPTTPASVAPTAPSTPTNVAPSQVSVLPTVTVVPTAPPRPPTATPIPPTATPSGPVVVRTGQFHGVEHEGAGTATIYRRPDGTLVLRLEDLDVLNGPDLYVYLSAAPDAADSATIAGNGFVSLGRLKGNKGNQNYDLPADLDISQFGSVSIWCQRFRVNFATAPLR